MVSSYDEPEDAAIFLPGFPYDDLKEISGVLAKAELLVPGYIPPEIGLYDLQGFLYEHHICGTKTVLLPDRNIVSRLARAAQGGTVDEHCRLAAAVLAFSQGLNIEIEPSIAFHELHPAQGGDAVRDELRWFREADDSDPSQWIALALNRLEQLPKKQPTKDLPEVDLSTPLKRWRRNYIVALKTAELAFIECTPLEKMLELFKWMEKEFIFAGPAGLYAAVYFAPNSPRSGLFKKLFSSDRERAIHGVRNAAWDVTHLSIFLQKIRESRYDDTRYLFATLDENLACVARLILNLDDTKSEHDAKVEALSQWWSPQNAMLITKAMFRALDAVQDPERTLSQQQKEPGYIDKLIEQGEALLRAKATSKQ